MKNWKDRKLTKGDEVLLCLIFWLCVPASIYVFQLRPAMTGALALAALCLTYKLVSDWMKGRKDKSEE